MPDTRTGHVERGPRALLWVQRVLVGTGVLLLGGVGLVIADAWVAQTQARRALDTLRTPAVVSPTLPGTEDAVWPDATGASATEPVAAKGPAPEPVTLTPGVLVGELTIPRLALDAMVLHGDDARTLRRGPGHIPGTALPGEPGTVAIAGHRDSFFRPIRNIRLGDDIFLDTPRGRFGYRVSSLRVVGPNDVSVLRSGEAGGTLTLITCYPFGLAGPAPDRFVVVAKEVVRPDGVAPMTDEPLPMTVADDGVESRSQQDVRRAIARFRAGYNSRLARHPEVDAGRLELRDCAITMGASLAAATCSDPAPSAGRTGVWIFTLRQGPGTWSIASVESR